MTQEEFIKMLILLDSEFVEESLSDWRQDMEDTESYYDEDFDFEWEEFLDNQEFDDLFSKLEDYKMNEEDDAYKEGYLPNAEGADVRNWSNVLSDYLL